jgi:hypothetical protein
MTARKRVDRRLEVSQRLRILAADAVDPGRWPNG